MTFQSPLPPCLSEPSAHWPLPLALPATALHSARFDPALLQAADFTACGIAPVRGVAKRQAEYLAGRLCARQALQRLTGTPGVPAVGEDRAPQWPAGVVGSITHGDGWAAALVGRADAWSGLGLDTELLLPAERARHLAEHILTPAELGRLSGTPEAQAWLTSLTFSLKESLFKALYPLVRQRFYFEHAELLDWTPAGTARLRLLQGLGPDWPAGSLLEGQFACENGRLLTLVAIPA
ncbi:4-phosphopantetheinyl transferase protein [Azotobacter vinelandii CA]|uniref:Enterobactin synthase component D n=2 Tax=Azotobacter vinelandii TaxID=354 RepID=C1DPR1_AZOVD|nr:4'-phosphopantetheinyl transferase superfamily protein [Azotobacter vinelandii]ACO79482.1 4-phosphopantetheinyl transferase protein [Azotobacter vinelandii DJ]AGK13829.1 4-phosphopantetheinyl transferase protein [Azotobacter vinelandii CA]AGK18471.1 4-phosphopantetheinyl transferase protein [Azotobacter vinelandii CA6]WKN20381.1 4'-phosphopantetheinyl transferase superfamily protein [Azotobacter vinelandii]SFX88850.1 enterobactin synthetase component D [Azotobacter vinelandii]